MSNESGDLHLGELLDGDSAGQPLGLPRHHLTTHGVIVGMTGSGKTGLGIVLLEEALASGVPALILDPKGDMGNLLLNFPNLTPGDFRPWIDEGEATREGMTPDQLAALTAERWSKGLERSGVGRDRLAHLSSSVEMRVLTPGSSAGIGMNILGDLSAPSASWETDAESIREEIEGLVSGILVLAGVGADPLTSREHILLSNLVERAWRDRRPLDLATLLREVLDPPMRRLGIYEVDAFYPRAERSAFAMRLNGLMASPSFAAWLEGEPVSVDSLLWAPDGRPRASVVYLAHLSETERQFVVTMLLSKVVTWMRGQPGTSDLRALVYVDEMFGFAPPTANPPCKQPFLTLFKQARAHGLGLVVSTQNPVDLDYKLMSNAGTWMVGRLQTERDKARILEGLRSASGDVDVSAWSASIGELGKREFLLKSTRSDQPTRFSTRWAMSYLRGPMTRSELSLLRKSGAAPAGPASVADTYSSGPMAPSAAAAAAPQPLADDESPVPPRVADGTVVRYLDAATPWARDFGIPSHGRRLRLGAAVRVDLLFDDTKADLRHEESWEAVLFPLGSRPDVSEAVEVDYDDRDFRDEAPDGSVYRLPDAPVDNSGFMRDLAKAFEEQVYRAETLRLMTNKTLKMYSRVNETEDAFAQRCLAVAEDRADEEAAKLRDRVENKLSIAQRRHAEAERRVRELGVAAGQRRQQEVIAGAGQVLSMFLGGRKRVSGLSGIASRRSTTVRAGERLRTAEEQLAARIEDIEEIEIDLQDDLNEIWAKWKSVAEQNETLEVGLEKTDIRLGEIMLFWAPEA